MRDRLIELLGAFPVWHSTLKDTWMPEAVDRLADHLLANGVIVPPVKIGQTVYRIRGNFGDIKIHEGFVHSIIVEADKMWFYVYGHPLHFTEDDLGKTVFLTKEQAEKALAEEALNEQKGL